MGASREKNAGALVNMDCTTQVDCKLVGSWNGADTMKRKQSTIEQVMHETPGEDAIKIINSIMRT